MTTSLHRRMLCLQAGWQGSAGADRKAKRKRRFKSKPSFSELTGCPSALATKKILMLHLLVFGNRVSLSICQRQWCSSSFLKAGWFIGLGGQLWVKAEQGWTTCYKSKWTTTALEVTRYHPNSHRRTLSIVMKAKRVGRYVYVYIYYITRYNISRFSEMELLRSKFKHAL